MTNKKITEESINNEDDDLVFSLKEKFIIGGICFGILVFAIIAANVIASMRIRPGKAERPAQVAIVETVQVSKQNKQIHVPAMGTVIPAVDIALLPEVSGRIISVNKNFVPGGHVAEGEVLVTVNPKDYEYDLIKKQAVLEKARAALKLEQGNQDVAKREWEILGSGDVSSDTDKDLALRKPQLMEAIADMNSAKADVELAKLDLQRTRVKSPFNAVIKETYVNIGEQVSTQTQIANLVGTNTYWVQVSLSVDALKYIDIKERLGNRTITATVTDNTGNVFSGNVIELLSDLDTEGKMARMIVEVNNVFDHQEKKPTVPLLLGDYVDVVIAGIEAQNIYVIPRSALRDNDQIFVMTKDKKLNIITPEIIWKGTNEVYIKGISADTEIITSDLSAPVQDMNVRKLSDAKGNNEDKAPKDVVGGKE
jgi:RND family efflux transporter MFP subunit